MRLSSSVVSFLSRQLCLPFPLVSPFFPSGEEFLSLWPYAWLEALAPSSASLSTSFIVRSLKASFPPQILRVVFTSQRVASFGSHNLRLEGSQSRGLFRGLRLAVEHGALSGNQFFPLYGEVISIHFLDLRVNVKLTATCDFDLKMY